MSPESEDEKDTMEKWKNSRSGAWAGRGFDYQYLISTLILVRQWAGLFPSGCLVPEGLEDCVVELPTCEYWLQIKSRKKGLFSKTEVQKILTKTNTQIAQVKGTINKKSAVILEQPCTDLSETNVDRLFEDTTEEIFICASPFDECTALLSAQLSTAEIIAEGIVSDLYRLVASASQENASLTYADRRRISTTEIERRIFERLEAEDPSAIDHALSTGVVEPVDLKSPVSEPAFYQGVKVTPGHVAAGLVLDRPVDRENIARMLKKRRYVLLSGQSGAGKSALLWSSVNGLLGIRWYQITARAVAADADVIIRFLRARRPTEICSIGLAFDEVGSINADLWDVLVRELRGIPFVYFLGSIRQEDIPLIANQADTEFIEVSLNEKLAESMWQKLSAKKETSLGHWRESFEQSEGLMLEYVHLLTQGKRLSTVIEDQVRQRQQEERYDELAIIRSTAVLCARGGEIQASKLFSLLGIKSSNASYSLARLIDEHLVRETRPGVMGGLHILRSDALSKASHDQIVYLSTDSLWQGLQAVTNDTLPRVIQSVLIDMPDGDEASTLNKLAKILCDSKDIDTWVSILTGLGLATLERRVVSFMNILELNNVTRAQWMLASMFSDSQVDIPELTKFDQWESLRNAIFAYHSLPKQDLRRACLDYLPKEYSVPSCQNLQQANKFLSSLAPICGGEPVLTTIVPAFVVNEEQDIREVAALLSTAYLISSDIAKKLIEFLGGEQILFDWFQAQTPWVSRPVIDSKGKYGQTIRADFFYVAENEQIDPHERICNICETLIAISLESEAAASDAVTPLGQPIIVGDYMPWSKNMPRENIVSKTRIAWNVAFRQILLARSASDSLTSYTSQMDVLVKRTEKVFRSFTEKWIKGKSIPSGLAEEIYGVVDTVNALAYAAPDNPAYEMSTPSNSADQDDTLGALLTGVLGNLIRRMNKIPGQEKPKTAATFSGSLAMQARDHGQSAIWRTSAKPPLYELASLAERLTDVSCILHELAYDGSPSSVQTIVKAARKGGHSKSIRIAARRCRFHADQRFSKRLNFLEKALNKKGWNTKCWSRPLDDADSPYWPAMEVAIAVEIENFEVDAEYIEDALSIGSQQLKNDWCFSTVPVLNGLVLAPLALLPSSHIPLPDYDFTKKWQEHIKHPFLSPITIKKFDEALTACMLISGVMACRNIEQLHLEEDQAFSNAIKDFERNRDFIFESIKDADSEYLAYAYDYLNEAWDRVVTEFETVKAGKTVKEPLCLMPHVAIAGQENDQITELASIRIHILQDECIRAG